MIQAETIKQLQQDLDETFREAESQRKSLRRSQAICHGAGALYVFFIIYLVFSSMIGFLDHNSPWKDIHIVVFMIPLFILLFGSNVYFKVSYIGFSELEKKSVRDIMERLFPKVACTIDDIPISKSTVINSKFFPRLENEGSLTKAFGSISFPGLEVYDLAIFEAVKKNVVTTSTVFSYIMLIQGLLQQAISPRFDSALYTFRGLYACAVLPKKTKKLKGIVIILPDKLEAHLDYLAETVQSMTTIDGCKLVKLEDPEFERHFKVYATDEVQARYVLTPLMMQQMSSLRAKYDRDVMFSFCEDEFHFAVSMPEGLLTLGDKVITDRNNIRIIYDNVCAAQSILKELRLK